MARTKKTETKVEEVVTSSVKPQISDFDVIIEPLITEKTMGQTQTANEATFKVAKKANKTQIKNAIERIYGVKVLDVRTINVLPKKTTRGTRHNGTIAGFKKAIVKIEKGQAIDLFRE